MTVYPLLDAELRNLQMFTFDVTLYSSISTGFAGYGISSLWEWFTTNDQFNGVRVGIWLFCFGVSVVSAAVAARAERGRESALEEMKKQAKTVGAPVKQV